MNMQKELLEILQTYPDHEISVSGDIAHKLDEDDIGVRVFSSDIVEVIVSSHRKEITIVMETADLNFSLATLMGSVISETIDKVVAENTNDKGGMNTTKRFKQRLKKELLISISKRLNQ
jgi:hypothetical protein